MQDFCNITMVRLCDLSAPLVWILQTSKKKNSKIQGLKQYFFNLTLV